MPQPRYTKNSTAIILPSCLHKTTAITSLGLDTTTNTRRSTAPSSNCKTSIIHSTSTTTQPITLNLSSNGKCSGSQTCRCSKFSCYCLKYGCYGITKAYYSKGCNPSFGIYNSNASINPSLSSTIVCLTYSNTAINPIQGSNKANTLTSATITTILSLGTSTKEHTLATITSTIRKLVFITTIEFISTTIATSIRKTHSSTTTL